jgi:general secretion pathway protein B
MSYILDAVKKSDRERQRQFASNLVAPHPEFRARQGDGPRAAAWLMAGSLAVASAVGGALLAMNWRGAQEAFDGFHADAVAPAQTTAPRPAPTVAGETPAASQSEPASAPAPAVEDITAPAVGLSELWELTEAEQRYLGALDVSLHVHSTDPAQRTVIVNGLRAGEGQSLGQDIRLLEITADGLIVEFRGRHVHLATVNAS